MLRLESNVWGRLVERKRSLDFDFPLAQASLYPAGPCQSLLFSKAKAHLPPSSVCLSALLCKQDPGLAARPHTGNEPAFRSLATSSSHPETPQSSYEAWVHRRRVAGALACFSLDDQGQIQRTHKEPKPSINGPSYGKPSYSSELTQPTGSEQFLHTMVWCGVLLNQGTRYRISDSFHPAVSLRYNEHLICGQIPQRSSLMCM